MAEAMAVEPGELLSRFQEAALGPRPWRETKAAPVQEVVHREVDLARLLPADAQQHTAGYITAGLMMAQPAYRQAERPTIVAVERSEPLGVSLPPRQAHMFLKWPAKGRAADAAIVVGSIADVARVAGDRADGC
jgi:2,5-furandicarboxylate decarboxylase 1